MSRVTRGPDGRPFMFANLPADAFPITLTAIYKNKEIWQRVIDPYVSVEIPGATEEQQGKVSICIKYATGEEVTVHPKAE